MSGAKIVMRIDVSILTVMFSCELVLILWWWWYCWGWEILRSICEMVCGWMWWYVCVVVAAAMCTVTVMEFATHRLSLCATIATSGVRVAIQLQIGVDFVVVVVVLMELGGIFRLI